MKKVAQPAQRVASATITWATPGTSGPSTPSQIPLANEVFSSSEAEVAKAQRIVDAMKQDPLFCAVRPGR
jgi:citrate lyase beta subunit